MRILVFGNSGSGKSTYAKALVRAHDLAHLDLDSIVWEPGQIAVERSRPAVRGSISAFLRDHSRWVIEGCYGELIQEILPFCTRLVLLNPGREACLRNNRQRPWEPHKYASSAQQNRMFEALQQWVAAYYTRDDDCSLALHRRLFDSYAGEKLEIRGSAKQLVHR